MFDKYILKDQKNISDSLYKEIENLIRDFEGQKEISLELEKINTYYVEKVQSHESTIQKMENDSSELKIRYDKIMQEKNLYILKLKNKVESKKSQVQSMQIQYHNEIKQMENKKHDEFLQYFDITEN